MPKPENGRRFWMEKNQYNPKYVQELFNNMSGSYERMNFITSFGFSIRWRRQLLKPLEETKRHVEIIDLMTGMGETWHALNRKLPNSKITALDFSEGMLKYAIQKSSTKFEDKINVLQQDVLNNQLPNNQFDYVICAFGLKTFNSEQLRILALETKRILKPGGEFSFIEVSKPNNPILKALYGFYLGKVIPILGRLFLGNPEEYKMLWRYTNQFGNAQTTSEIFKNTGLKTNYNTFFFGCASGFHGSKIDD